MKKTKLLHISFAGGGVDISIRLINKNLDPTKFEIHVIRETEHTPYYNKTNNIIPSDIIPVKREISFTDVKNIILLWKLTKNINPDIIHVHSAKAGILGRIMGQFLGVKIFYTPHAFSFLSTPNNAKRKIYLLIEKIVKVFSRKSKIIACSLSEYYRAIENIGYPKEKVKLFNNSIPKIIKSSLIVPKSINLPSRYICTIGRPSYQKNLIVMIKVLKDLHLNGHKETLVIMGVGFYSPELENIKKTISKFKLVDYVILLPWVKRNEALGILNKSLLYISTALYEGLPLSIIEAMALGVPSVISDVDGNKDLIINHHNGYLIKDMDITEFSKKITLLLNNNKQRNIFSIQVKKDYNSNFDSKKNISKLETIYLS